jgi:hypothetical protein
MNTDNSNLRDICLKLTFYAQNPKQKEINTHRTLTLQHIRSRPNPEKVPFKTENEYLKISTSSAKKLEFDLNYFKKIGEIVVIEDSYFDLLQNRTIPRNKFVIPTYKLEKDSFEELKNNYLDSLNFDKEKK